MCPGGTRQVRVASGLVSLGLIEQVRFRQRAEVGEGELAKWTCGRSELWGEERARTKVLGGVDRMMGGSQQGSTEREQEPGGLLL